MYLIFFLKEVGGACIYMTRLTDDHQLFQIISISTITLLGLLSTSAGVLSAAAWMEDFCRECASATLQKSVSAQHAEAFQDHYNLMRRIFGSCYCFIFSFYQVLSILSIYRAISGTVRCLSKQVTYIRRSM